MGEAGADVVGVDFRVPLAEALARVGGRYAVQGNLDPALLFAPWEALERRVRAIVEEGRAAPGHIFNLGHGVLPDTDPDVLTRVVELVHEVVRPVTTHAALRRRPAAARAAARRPRRRDGDVLSDAGLYAFTGGSPPTRRVTRTALRAQVAGPGRPDEEWHNWVVRLGADGPAVGYVQATVDPRRGGRARLGGRGALAGAGHRPRGRRAWCSSTCGSRARSPGSSPTCTPTTSPRSGSPRRSGLAPTDRRVDGEVEWERVGP